MNHRYRAVVSLGGSDGAPPGATDVAARKTALRLVMRARRRAICDRDGPERSARIGTRVREIVADRLADESAVAERRGAVMVFTPIRGEPAVDELVAWCRTSGRLVVVPEDEPDPDSLDVVVVPGLAFTHGGHRLGQGGGWYDRFLAGLPDRVVTIGVGFAEQVVVDLPLEPHDVPLDMIVTDAGVVAAPARHPPIDRPRPGQISS